MQIVKILAFSAFITLFQIRGCNNIEGVSNSATVEKNRPIMTSIPAQIDYKLASRDCFAEESCLAFVSVKKKFQNEKALVDLSEFLNSKRPKKGKLIVYFFETFNTAKAFADVKKPP